MRTNYLLLFENKDIKKIILRLKFKVDKKCKIKKKFRITVFYSLTLKMLKKLFYI